MILTIYLRKTVATVEEGATLTNAVKNKLTQYPEIKVTATCIEEIAKDE